MTVDNYNSSYLQRPNTEYVFNDFSTQSLTSRRNPEPHKSSSSQNIQRTLLFENINYDLTIELQTWSSELREEENRIKNSKEISEEVKNIAIAEARRRRANYNYSRVLMDNFLEFYKEVVPENYYPAISIDGDGEITFEWYGRKGARAILTFGENWVLYFVTLFHGEVYKYQLFLNNRQSPQEIKTNLAKIYRDKKI